MDGVRLRAIPFSIKTKAGREEEAQDERDQVAAIRALTEQKP